MVRPNCRCHGEPMWRNGSETSWVCRVLKRTRSMEWKAQNVDRRRIYQSEYYQAHKEEILVRTAAWKANNPDKELSYQDKYIRSGKKARASALYDRSRAERRDISLMEGL